MDKVTVYSTYIGFSLKTTRNTFVGMMRMTDGRFLNIHKVEGGSIQDSDQNRNYLF